MYTDIWARVGMSVNVNKELFKRNPTLAIFESLCNGNASFDGESYIPDGCGLDGGEGIDFEVPFYPAKLVFDPQKNREQMGIYNVKEAADLIGISTRQILHAIRKKEIPSIKLSGRYCVTEKDVLEYRNQSKGDSNE
jgi:excisionase family DNA binding protein